MGALFLVRRTGSGTTDPRFQVLRTAFQDQEWGTPVALSAGGCDICVFPKRSDEAVSAHIVDAANFCVATGTLLYRKTMGAAAVERLYVDLTSDTVHWDEMYGHFCVVAARQDTLTVFVDRLGTYPVFHDSRADVLSTSFVGVLAAMPAPRVDPQGVYEYVFQGATYGGTTVIDGIERMDGATGFRFRADRCAERVIVAPAVDHPSGERSFDDYVARNVANLRRYFEAIVACFGERVDTALSGGYDSRLTLALLREQGITPRLHVYGGDNDPDVTVAKAIAAGEGLALTHTNKSGAPRIEPCAFAAAVSRNLHLFDGTPPDGILDDGADIRTRLERCAGGELMLNGGGGEIFRNFFYLPDGSRSTRHVMWSFYSRFDPALCTARFDEAAYYAALGPKIREAAGAADDRLARDEIERLYVTFRCRYWMGRNNGVNNALGYALTPFIDANVTPAANATPLRYKNYGRLEAAMIRQVSPALAAYGSAYGHSFAGDPPMRRMVKDLATILRPPALRRYTYRLHRRSRESWPYFLAPPYIAAILKDGFPFMRTFFVVDRIADSEQFIRICTLEHLFQRYGAALQG